MVQNSLVRWGWEFFPLFYRVLDVWTIYAWMHVCIHVGESYTPNEHFIKITSGDPRVAFIGSWRSISICSFTQWPGKKSTHKNQQKDPSKNSQWNQHFSAGSLSLPKLFSPKTSLKVWYFETPRRGTCFWAILGDSEDFSMLRSDL